MRVPSKDFVPAQVGMTDDPLILYNMTQASKESPIKGRTLLLLAVVSAAILTIVVVLTRLQPGNRPSPELVAKASAESAVVFLFQGQGDSIERVTAVEMVWQGKNKYTHVTYTAKDGQTLQRVYYGSHTQGEHFDPAAQELGEKQVHYDNWQAAKEKGSVLQFTPRELEDLMQEKQK